MQIKLLSHNKERIKSDMISSAFISNYLSIFMNPFFIIRHGIYKSVATFAPQMTGDILDFGCGSKPYESLFTNINSYFGVDISKSGHDHISSKVDVFYDGKHLPFKDAQFDVVVCFEVLEHVFNINETLQEIKRTLKLGGVLMFSIPFAWEEHEIPYDFARYTSFGISHILQSNKFEIISLVKTNTYFLAVSQMFIAYLFQYVLPKGKYTIYASLLLIIFPLNALSLMLNKILPKQYTYYTNCFVVGKKIG